MPGYFKKFGQKFKLNEWNFQEFMNNWTHHLQPHLHCGQVKSIWSPMTSFSSFTSAGKDLTMLNIYSAYKSLASCLWFCAAMKSPQQSFSRQYLSTWKWKGFSRSNTSLFQHLCWYVFSAPFRINTKVFLRILEITTVSVATYILIAWWPYPDGIQRIFL